MNSIPEEINTLIISQFDSKLDLANARLVSKGLSAPATRALFSKIHVTPQELEAEPSQLVRVRSILGTPALANEVRHVLITTSPDPNKGKDEYTNEEEESVLSEEMESAIALINKFPNVNHVGLEFSNVCSFYEDLEDGGFSYTMEAEESFAFRTEVLKKLFAALNDDENPMKKLATLSIKNLQDKNDEALTTSENFLSVLKRISELRLFIVSEYDEASPETSMHHPELHTFYAELPSVWLKPARENLTSLTIHADVNWGYLPRIDLRPLHFPRLRRLEFGNYVFTHDWQFEWIFSHGDTLEELVLDDCPIIPHLTHYGLLDEEKYPTVPDEDGGDVNIWNYERQWTWAFKEFEGKLLKLKVFRFGIGEWFYGRNFDGADWEQEGVHGNRYMGLHGGIGPSPWLALKDYLEVVEDRELVDKNNIDEEDDKAAYKSLMATAAKRAAKC